MKSRTSVAVAAIILAVGLRAGPPEIESELMPLSRSASIPLSEFEAWNIAILRSSTISGVTGRPVFTPDFRELALVSANGDGLPSIEFYSLAANKLVRRIALPAKDRAGRRISYRTTTATSASEDSAVTFSPDGKKLIYGPVSVDEGKSYDSLLRLELSTRVSDVIEIKSDAAKDGNRSVGVPLGWPAVDIIDLFNAAGANELNSSTATISPTTHPLTSGRPTNTTHQKIVLENTKDGLVVTSRSERFSRLLTPENAYSWSHDGQYVVFLRPGKARVVELAASRRPKPALDFAIKDGLSPTQRDQLTKEITEGGKIWGTLYAGPAGKRASLQNPEDIRGLGFFTITNSELAFHLSYELKPLDAEPFASKVQREQGWAWDTSTVLALQTINRNERHPTATPANPPTGFEAYIDRSRTPRMDGKTERALATLVASIRATPAARAYVMPFTSPPPRPPLEIPPRAMQSGAHWVAGYWGPGRSTGYQWIPGHWETVPPGAGKWIEPKWYPENEAYTFHPGHWTGMESPILHEELALLLGLPLEPPAVEDRRFSDRKRKIVVAYPAGYLIDEGSDSIVARFRSPVVDGGSILVSCARPGLLARQRSLQQEVEGAIESVRVMPGAQVSAPAKISMCGVDAQVFLYTDFQQGSLYEKACAVAVSKNVVLSVIMSSQPERFPSMWDEFRRVCMSYELMP